MKKSILLFLVLTMTSIFNHSLALAADDLSNSKTLMVHEGESVTLKPGFHSFNKIVLEKNSTIYLLGTTSLFAKKMFSSDQARIEYIPGSAGPYAKKRFTLLITDGRNINGEFHLVGNGADGAKGIKGKNGGRGSNETCKLLKARCNSAGKGGNGAQGGQGYNGEHGMDFYVSINKINLNSIVTITSIGGAGGEGGDGGNGGRGGDGKYLGGGSRGGNGGDGGVGGTGGDGGKITASLVHPDNTPQKTLMILKAIMDQYYVSDGGIGGMRGRGGSGADGAPGGTGPIKTTRARSGNNGHSGNDGNDGMSFRPEKYLVPASEYTMRATEIVDNVNLDYLINVDKFHDTDN